MDSIVGHSQRVTSVEEIPLAVAQCFAAMTTGRPRPAYLEIPLDLLAAVAVSHRWPPSKAGSRCPLPMRCAAPPP